MTGPSRKAFGQEMSYKVLVVEDEKNIILGVKTCLEVADYQVVVAETGEEALAEVERNRPDIILLDLLLPGISGYQVCSQLKEDPKTKDIPIVVLSAKAEEEDMRRAKEAGADSYLTKPFRPKELWAELERFLPSEKNKSAV
ncbi:MAG: response regulator [Firmicutes bacterium]|nr:response regulator [Bacillota bacterium]